jgi:AcrR family transcriptional regulator
MVRLTRPEQTARNRRQVLDAAAELFRRKGFHGATLEEIADEAGFSKGVIYSQFGSKDDLVLALMEERSQQRIARVLELARRAPPDEALREIAGEHRAFQRADVQWTLLVLEFRIHAARTPDLERRYAALHRRTLEGVAQVFEVLQARGELQSRFEPADFARFIAALDSGNVLERLAEGPGDAFELARRALWLLLTDAAEAGDPEDPAA